MAQGTPENPFYTENPYPMKGYVMDADGHHSGGQWLHNQTQLYKFIHASRGPALEGMEVMVTDNMDCATLHVKEGKVIFPRTNPELIAHYEN